MTYKHSVKLPSTYRKASKFLRDILQNNKSLKTLIYNDSHIVSENFRLIPSIFFFLFILISFTKH